MSHQEYVFLVALVACTIGIAALAVVGGLALWLLVKQPAKWKALCERFQSFLVAKRLLPASVAHTLDRYESPALVKSLFVIGLLGCIVALCFFIPRIWLLLR